MADVAILGCTIVFDLFILVYFVLSRKIQKGHGYVFLMLFASIALSAVCSFISSFFGNIGIVNQETFLLAYTADFLYFIFHSLLPFLYAAYVMIVDGHGIKKDPLNLSLFLSPLLIAEILVVLTPFFDLVFYYNEAGKFVRGPLEIAIYIEAAIYVGIASYYMIRYRKALTFKDNTVLWLFFCSALIGVVIQFLNKELKVELFTESMALLGLIFTVENEPEFLDPATKIYNRRAFLNDNRKFLETRSEYAVITINITNFRLYAKMLSYNSTTNLLNSIIDWITGLSSSLIMYRISTTKFALIYLYNSREEVDFVVDSITDRFEEGWSQSGITVDFNLMVGVAFIPEEINDPETILSLAHENIFINTGTTKVFRGDDLKVISRRDKVEIAVRKAIDSKSLMVYYQPIWCADDGKIHTAEALVRLKDDELGFIPPSEFIPIAEKTGLISNIGLFVFDEVCRFLSHEGKELNLEYIEINLSLYQLLVGNIAIEFSNILNKYGVLPSQINLEITETEAPSLNKSVTTNVDELHRMGVSFSLDDFGTGYSNLNYLVNMNFANIKIDKSLLWDAVKKDSSSIIINDTTSMMRKLGMNVIQEGVEDKEQLALALAFGANYIQGYYFSKPLPQNDFITYVRRILNE